MEQGLIFGWLVMLLLVMVIILSTLNYRTKNLRSEKKAGGRV